jgi:hypothetical protein
VRVAERSRAGRRLLGATMLLAAALVSSCELDKVTVNKTTATVVVHGVLNANATTQVVLVERTLTGAVTIPEDVPFDGADPIVTGGGVPVSGATAEITDSTGRVFRGVEDKTLTGSNGKGAGVYRFPLGPPALRLGMRYQLHIRTAEGEDVTAFTRVPRPLVATLGGLTRTFNRDRDTLLVFWNRVANARSYAVRVESPFGPFFLFTDSSRFLMTGELRNLFAGDLQRVFIPGFRQDILVTAVDSNFYDYYRTGNDPFTGSGIINRVVGGLGLWGSLVALNSGTLSVVANQTEPVEGRWNLTSSSTDPSIAVTLNLYVESKAARSDLPEALSGRYTTSPPGARSDAILGSRLGSTVTLTLLSNQLSGDTLDVFTGEMEGNTLTGSYNKRVGQFVYRKP